MLEGKIFINFNGKFFNGNESIFHFGFIPIFSGVEKVIVEKMRAFASQVPFIENHIYCLKEKFRHQQLSFPSEFTSAFFQNTAKGLFIRNRRYKGAFIKLSIFPHIEVPDSLLFTNNSLPPPLVMNRDKTAFSFIFEMLEDAPAQFEIAETKWICAAISPSEFEEKWDKYYPDKIQQANWMKSDNKLNEIIFTDNNGYLVEGLQGSIFAVIGNELHTPSKQMGLTPSVIREKVIEASKLSGLQIIERNDFHLESLSNPQPDAFFSACELKGIQPILGINQYRFSNKKLELINRNLNQLLLDKII